MTCYAHAFKSNLSSWLCFVSSRHFIIFIMEGYLNLFEHIPEDEHSHISNKIWEALDRAGIELSQDAELSIRIYDDNYEGEYDGEEYDS